jgi:hypothetical protein
LVITSSVSIITNRRSLRSRRARSEMLVEMGFDYFGIGR